MKTREIKITEPGTYRDGQIVVTAFAGGDISIELPPGGGGGSSVPDWRHRAEVAEEKLRELETFADAHGKASGYDTGVLYPRVVLDIIRRPA